MSRPITIAEWTMPHRNGIVRHISAALSGNRVTLHECEESATFGWAGSVEMPADVLLQIASAIGTSDRREPDDRQMHLWDRSEY